MEATEVKKKLINLLRSFDTVMVATHATDNATIHARPMAVAEIDDGGDVWFVTPKDADKVDEGRVDRRAAVTAQRSGAYVSLSGTIDVLSDPERVRSLWKEQWRAWFREGPNDTSIALWRFVPEIGEYWDDRRLGGVRYLFAAARALFDGERMIPVSSAREHAKVPM